MRTPSFLPALVLPALAVALVGCSSSDDTTIVGDTGTGDTAADTAIGDTASDTGTADSAADTASDTGGDTGGDSTADTGGDTAGTVEASTTATVTANCMPVVPADPATIGGTLTVKNGSASSVGPVTVEFGVLKTAAGVAYATWKIDKIDLGTIAAGATKSQAWKKTADTYSSDPSDAICKKCGSDVVVEITVQGLGSSGRPVAAPVGKVSCAF